MTNQVMGARYHFSCGGGGFCGKSCFVNLVFVSTACLILRENRHSKYKSPVIEMDTLTCCSTWKLNNLDLFSHLIPAGNDLSV